MELDLKNIPNAPQPGTTFSKRKEWMDNTRFIDVRNLAAYHYPNPDGSKLMQYNDTLADAEHVIKTLLHYELSNGLIVDDGTAQAYFTAPSQQAAQAAPAAAPQQQAAPTNPAAPAGVPQMSFAPPAFGPPPQNPQQPQQFAQQAPPQQFAAPPGAAPAPAFQQQPPNAAQAAQAAGGPPTFTAPQQGYPAQPQQQPPPPAPEQQAPRAGRKSKGAAVAAPPAAPPPNGAVQTFIPGTAPAPVFGAPPQAAPQTFGQAPAFGQPQQPQFQQQQPQAFGQPQQQVAPVQQAAPVAVNVDLGPVIARLDAIGAGLTKDSAEKDKAIVALKQELDVVVDSLKLVVCALNHLYLSNPDCKASATSLGYTDGSLKGFMGYLKTFIPPTP